MFQVSFRVIQLKLAERIIFLLLQNSLHILMFFKGITMYYMVKVQNSKQNDLRTEKNCKAKKQDIECHLLCRRVVLLYPVVVVVEVSKGHLFIFCY